MLFLPPCERILVVEFVLVKVFGTKDLVVTDTGLCFGAYVGK